LDETAIVLAELAGATAKILDMHREMADDITLSTTMFSQLEDKYDQYDKAALKAYTEMQGLATSALANATSGAQEILNLVDKTLEVEASNDDIIAAVRVLLHVALVSATSIFNRIILSPVVIISTLAESGVYNTTASDWQRLEECLMARDTNGGTPFYFQVV
ncbi:hypothetical protein Vretifemale_3561, partial [Volvox reticuliferus]